MADLDIKMLLSLKDNATSKLKNFQGALKGTEKTALSFGSALKTAGVGIASAVTGILGLSTALAGAGAAAISYADHIGKAAAVSDITSESLQELRYAFDQFGLSARETDDGLRRFARRLGEFTKSGGGPAKAAFDQMGLSSDILSGKLSGTENTFNAVVDIMGQMTNTAQKSALAAQLFGDDAGPKLALALGQGIEKIDALRAKARDLGLVLSNETVKAAESANDQLSTMWQIVKVQLTAAFLKLTPQIKQFADLVIANRGKIIEFAQNMGELAVQVVKVGAALAKSLVNWLKFFGVVEYSLEQQVAKAANAYQELLQRGKLRWQSEDAYNKQLAERRKTYSDLLDQLVAIQKAQSKVLDDQQKNAPKTGTVGKLPGNAIGGVLTPTDTKMMDEQVKAYQKHLEDAAKQHDQLMTEGKRVTEENMTAQEKYNAEIDHLNNLLLEGAINEETFSRASNKAFKDMQDAASQTNEFMRQAARNMQSDFSSFFFDVMQGNLTDLAGSFKRTIDKMVADLLASKLLTFVAGNFSETGVLGGLLGSMFRANGGPVSAGKPYIVGEQGPELMIPKTAGSVVPNKDLNKMGGGNTVNVNITAMDSQDVYRALEQNKRPIAELLFGAANTYNLRRT